MAFICVFLSTCHKTHPAWPNQPGLTRPFQPRQSLHLEGLAVLELGVPPVSLAIYIKIHVLHKSRTQSRNGNVKFLANNALAREHVASNRRRASQRKGKQALAKLLQTSLTLLSPPVRSTQQGSASADWLSDSPVTRSGEQTVSRAGASLRHAAARPWPVHPSLAHPVRLHTFLEPRSFIEKLTSGNEAITTTGLPPSNQGKTP